MKDQQPQPMADLKDIKLFKRVGIQGIKHLPNAKRILTRLCNSNYITEGTH
jgi:hypothetical protein